MLKLKNLEKDEQTMLRDAITTALAVAIAFAEHESFIKNTTLKERLKDDDTDTAWQWSRRAIKFLNALLEEKVVGLIIEAK
jgi:hypothetical protein